MMLISIQKWGGPGGDTPEKLFEIQLAEELVKLIYSITADFSTTLSFETDIDKLYINSNQGIFTVTAVVGENEFYDLIGDVKSIGMGVFVLGGQKTEHPKKYFVTIEQVIKVSVAFYKSGELLLNESHWDYQS